MIDILTSCSCTKRSLGSMPVSATLDPTTLLGRSVIRCLFCALTSQASGAYVFRPNCTEDTPVPCDPIEINPGNVNLTITVGQGVQEV